WKHDTSITYKHVYQHNQTDMEFLRMRAARMGCHVWCVGTTLNVKQPDFGNDSGKKLTMDAPIGDAPQLRGFHPRTSSAPVVKKTTVKGWNTETKELITGEAEAQDSQLGSRNASSAAGDQGSEETYTVDHPIWSKDEATAHAKARHLQQSLTYCTAEAECIGD